MEAPKQEVEAPPVSARQMAEKLAPYIPELHKLNLSDLSPQQRSNLLDCGIFPIQPETDQL